MYQVQNVFESGSFCVECDGNCVFVVDVFESGLVCVECVTNCVCGGCVFVFECV